MKDLLLLWLNTRNFAWRNYFWDSICIHNPFLYATTLSALCFSEKDSVYLEICDTNISLLTDFFGTERRQNWNLLFKPLQDKESSEEPENT